jgi:hypothetical protein
MALTVGCNFSKAVTQKSKVNGNSRPQAANWTELTKATLVPKCNITVQHAGDGNVVVTSCVSPILAIDSQVAGRSDWMSRS